MAYTEIRGIDLVISYGGVAVLGRRNASINIQAETIDAGHAGSFPAPRKLPSEYSWGAELSGVNKMDGAIDDGAFDDFETAMTTGNAIATVQFAKNGKLYSGEVLVTRLSYSGEYKGVMQYNVTFEGSGALTIA